MLCTTNNIVRADIHELSVERPDYLGLDRTDAGLSGRAVTNATAHIDPAPASATYNWTKCGKCQFVGATDWRKATYGITNSATASTKFLAEDLKVTATAKNADGLSASATCTTNFTVVAVDVQIGSVGEDKEEKEGAFLSYVADTNGVISVEGTNKMVEVKFTCKPKLLENEMVTISHTGPGELYEVLQSGELVPVWTNDYPACEIAERTFKLHGHSPSTNIRDGKIEIRHSSSSAKDTANYTNFGIPLLVPDYNRDGRIDGDDISRARVGGTEFWFWVNDDNDDGNENTSPKDRPHSGKNGQNDEVDGRCDLLDFTPVLLDITDVFPPGTPSEVKDGVSWKLQSSAVNAVLTSLTAENAGSFHKQETKGFGTDRKQYAFEADVINTLGSGYLLPDDFQRDLRANGKAVILVEGRAAARSLKMQGCRGNGSSAMKVVEGSLNIHVTSVEEMYQFVSLRGAESNPNFVLPKVDRTAYQEKHCSERDVFFTHGFNVDATDARAWGSEVFKRLWQSGSNARFWALTWAGDYNWLGSPFNALHYPQDVYQAFMTADALKQLVETVQPDSSKRVLMTQSLGNGVACEALRRNLRVDKYFMFDAAIPSEAVDGSLQDANAEIRRKYVPSDWNGYDPASWAANWHKWFSRNEQDMRGKMGWPNYFQAALNNATTVYNYYSTGDNVFKENEDPPGVLEGMFHWPTLAWEWPPIKLSFTGEMYCWQKQETLKGMATVAGTLSGGWGFHYWPVQGIYPDDVEFVRYSAATVAVMVANGSITNNPVFNRGAAELLNPNASLADQRLALAKHVPAISTAMGRTSAWEEKIENHDLNGSVYQNGWGRHHSTYGTDWQHSDMKDMAYFYVYKLYDEIVNQKGSLK